MKNPSQYFEVNVVHYGPETPNIAQTSSIYIILLQFIKFHHQKLVSIIIKIKLLNTATTFIVLRRLLTVKYL